MIGTDEDRRKTRSLDRNELFFMRDNITEEPFFIRVPLVTRKQGGHYLVTMGPAAQQFELIIDMHK
jgi:hypothetical protein